MTETYLTDDDVSALEVLEAGGDLTDDQVSRLQALENTPFFAQTIQQSEATSRRFAGAGFGPDGFVMSDTSSPIVQAQPDPVPPTGGPVREEEPATPQKPAQQPADDGMRFDLVTPPPIDAVEMQTNIRGPRLGAMGPTTESGDFFRDDEELLEALEAAPAKGIMLTREDFQTREELREKNSDTIGTLTTGAGNVLSGLWEVAKGAVVEQGASAPAAIGQALSTAAFDPANAGKILADGVKEASNRVVQAEVTKAEGARKAYIGVRQLWSWMEGTIENIEIDDERRQAVRNDMIASGAFGQDNVANAKLLEAEIAKRKEQGLAPFAPTDKTAEYDIKYRRYWENEKLNRAYAGQNQYILDGKVIDEPPDIALSQQVTGFNPATGQQIQPQPYTSMLYGMAMQPDTYVGFGAGYFSKLRVLSRAAAASRPLFGGIELTAAKAAEVAKIGKDAQKFLRNSTIASGGLFTTGAGLSLNDNTGTLGKGLMFFGGILPAMRAAGFVLKRVPVANRFLEAGGILRPQALRIIAEESKAGPLGAGAAANTPATQAAAIRAARPAAAERLAASGEVPQRYARFMGTKRTRQGDLNIQAAGQRGFDSTLKRVAQNPENPANVRRAARTADELGLTQVFRATDDAIGGAIAGLVGSAPFAAIAPDDQTAGGILAAGASLGAAGGLGGSVTSFRGDAVDADIARFMADTDALGGDTKALFQMPHKHLAAMSSLQGIASNKGVDVVALRTEDYNRMVPEAIGAQGYFSAPTAKDGSKAGRQRIFVDLGHSSLEEGTARITQAPDGMYELTVVRKDGSVAYPLPAADGSQPVIRRKSANDFTVKDGDPISPYFPLNRQPPRIVTASHEFMHALMKSDMFGGDHQPALRGLIYEQYKPDTIQSMAREYAQRLVDAQINNGAVPKPANDDAKAKMIDDMVTELDDASVASTGDRRAWIADEIVAETWQDIAQSIDVNRIRQGKSADGRVVDAARSAMIATTRALETFGMKFDWATGKPLTNPSTVFRDNPLATTPLLRKRILESVRNYDRYLTLLEDAGAVESKGAPLPRSGRAEDWLAEGTMRTHRKADGSMENDVMTVDPDGQVRWKEQDQINREYQSRSTAVSDLLKRLGTKMVDDNDPTFGLRRAGVGRTIYSGAELPMSDSPLGYPPVLAAFPEYYRTMYRDAVDSGRAGELVRFSNNTVGTRSDSGGPYRLSQLISSGYAKQSEGLFYGMQITKSGGHMNMQFVDMNAFKASALRAINDGKIPFFNNDYKEVVRNLKQLMDNYRNKRDGSYMIGEEGKNILNGLLYGKSRANDGWGAKLNARGSIRTYRMDRMNWIERTGDDGYFFDNDRAKNNRMPETEPVDDGAYKAQAQFMPDTVISDEGGTVWRTLQEAPVITLKDLRGRKVFASFADLTSAGKLYRGIDSSEVAIPVRTHGGPEWPLLQEERVGEETNVWSNQGAGVSTTKAKRADEGAIMLVAAMHKNAHVSNTETSTAVIATNAAYARDGRIAGDNLQRLDDMIRAEMPDFVGIESPDVMSYVNRLPFQGERSRSRIAQILGSKEAEALGAPNLQRILDEMRSSEFDGLRIGDAVMAIELTAGAPVLKLGENGTLKHPSYQYAVRGRVLGRFARPINVETIFDDFYAQRRAQGKPQQGDRRALDLAKPVQVITDAIADRIPSTAYTAIKSPRHAQLINMAVNDQWRSTSASVKQGGVSPADIVSALNASPAKVALSRYDLKTLSGKVRAKELEVFQLGDSGVYFGVRKGDPASDYGLAPDAYGFGPDERTLTLVMNNERKAGGMADAIVVKALQNGVTALDCFAVKSGRSPSGFLPELYERFGFQRVGEMPFDPSFYSKTELADLKKYWKTTGWDESAGMPSIVLMKWKGTNEQRPKSLRELVSQGSSGIRQGDRGGSVFRDAKGSSGRISGQRSGSKRRTGQGDAGSGQGVQGSDAGVRLGRGLLGPVEELIGLSPAELRNLGIQ